MTKNRGMLPIARTQSNPDYASGVLPLPPQFVAESVVCSPRDQCPRIRPRSLLDCTSSLAADLYIPSIDAAIEKLLAQEDLDHNCQITLDDYYGLGLARIGTDPSDGYERISLEGMYCLSNLLQELYLARKSGRHSIVLPQSALRENPVSRLTRRIGDDFWPALTRQVSTENIMAMTFDTKIVDSDGRQHRVYVPHTDSKLFDFYLRMKSSHPGLDVQYLPKVIDAQYIRSINDKPGLLALALTQNQTGEFVGQPYIVPGGRFNEFYGWDLYMLALGLLASKTHEIRNWRLCRGMAENFIYEIDNYGKILNANRLYYLGRSQPPFLTDLCLRTYERGIALYGDLSDLHEFLKRSIRAAIKEYSTVWCAEPRLDRSTGLSCYHPDGLGVPPETEAGHFDAHLKPFATALGISIESYIRGYTSGEIHEPELDSYFLNDRAVRESGHDTSYRLEGRCASLVTADLNLLLYKYEIDIATTIDQEFGGDFENQSLQQWHDRALARKVAISKYLWNEKDCMFYDYDIRDHIQTRYESPTCLWPLWCGAASESQAQQIVRNSLHKLEEFGGLVGSSLQSRGTIGSTRPMRQWDYPFGWAPHQMVAWESLRKYGFTHDASRLAYKWMYMMLRSFISYNGVVVEKYNVLENATPHVVAAEYGNQGVDFEGVANEGFGWVNASFIYAQLFLTEKHAASLRFMVSPRDLFEMAK